VFQAVTGGLDHLVCVVNLQTGKSLGALQGHTDSVEAVALSTNAFVYSHSLAFSHSRSPLSYSLTLLFHYLLTDRLIYIIISLFGSDFLVFISLYRVLWTKLSKCGISTHFK
jgi:hypothetical protein